MLTGARQPLLSVWWPPTVDSSKGLPGRLLLASLVSKASHHNAVTALKHVMPELLEYHTVAVPTLL